MAKIKEIHGRKILDSRGEPTVEVKIITDGAFVGIDSIPSGTSTGKNEAALVDVDAACSNINNVIAPQIVGMDVEKQQDIDQKMIDLDDTPNKSKLGANSILGISLATARVAALVQKKPLYRYINQLFTNLSGVEIKPKIPTPMMVMICGGKHVVHAPKGHMFRKESNVGNNLCIQEFLIMGKLQDGVNIWHAIEKIIKDKKLPATLGLEGAFSIQLPYDEDAISLINEAASACSLQIGKDVLLGFDVAGNHCVISNDQVVELFRRHNLYSIEDPFGEEDWEKFGQLKLELDELNKPYLLIGDDIFATHRSLLKKGITQRIANSIIIKINQVGTLTEVLEVVNIAYKANYKAVVSHRSGETIDTFIADLSCGIAAEYLKAGAPIPNERLLKYKRLKEIEQEL